LLKRALRGISSTIVAHERIPETAMPTSVTPASEQSNPAEEIGERLVRLRAERSVKVSELARTIGVSPSLISQIERGQSRPSVSTLFAMAEALDVPVDAFFRDSHAEPEPEEPTAGRGATEAMPEGEHRYVVHKDDRAVIDIEGGVHWERLTPATLDHLDFLELVYAPRAESNETLYRHPGTEMVLVMSGRLDIFVGFERYELGPGDSIGFPSTTPHRYLNPTDQTTRAVTVILAEGEERPWNQTRRP
jgi:transcriptional regulator with XRE-family HTH domain